MVAFVFLDRREASSPILNMMWSRSLALVLNPAVPYCKHNPSGFEWKLDCLDTSSNIAIFQTNKQTHVQPQSPFKVWFFAFAFCHVNSFISYFWHKRTLFSKHDIVWRNGFRAPGTCTDTAHRDTTPPPANCRKILHNKQQTSDKLVRLLTLSLSVKQVDGIIIVGYNKHSRVSMVLQHGVKHINDDVAAVPGRRDVPERRKIVIIMY